MSVNKSDIYTALMDLGKEKMEAAGSLEELAALLAEQGLKVSPQEVAAALQEAAKLGSKQELGEEELEQVAGGAWWEYLIPGYGTYAAVRDLVKYNQNQESQTAPGTPAAPGGSSNPQNNTQANTNNHSAQQASQTGNNQNSGGMNVS